MTVSQVLAGGVDTATPFGRRYVFIAPNRATNHNLLGAILGEDREALGDLYESQGIREFRESVYGSFIAEDSGGLLPGIRVPVGYLALDGFGDGGFCPVPVLSRTGEAGAVGGHVADQDRPVGSAETISEHPVVVLVGLEHGPSGFGHGRQADTEVTFLFEVVSKDAKPAVHQRSLQTLQGRGGLFGASCSLGQPFGDHGQREVPGVDETVGIGEGGTSRLVIEAAPCFAWHLQQAEPHEGPAGVFGQHAAVDVNEDGIQTLNGRGRAVVLVVGRGCGRGALGGGGEGEESEGDAEIHLAFLLSRRSRVIVMIIRHSYL